jgi:hypothetical protein
MATTAMDIKIINFLDSLKMLDVEKHKILEKLRVLIFDSYPDISERMQYGGILFSLDDDVAGLFAYTHHISLEFGHGATFNDPNNLLEGKGKYRRHLKFTSMEEIEKKQTIFYITQIEN